MDAGDNRPIPAVIAETATLLSPDHTRDVVARYCTAHGWAEPVWLETTAAAPGTAQARIAVAQHADVVIALGSDRTIRAVATGLLGAHTALGVLPMGCDSAVATALGILPDGIHEGLMVCLSGDDLQVMPGEADILTADGTATRTVFIKSAGLRRTCDDHPALRVTVDDTTHETGGVDVETIPTSDPPTMSVRFIAPDGTHGTPSVITGAAVVARSAEPCLLLLDGAEPLGEVRSVRTRPAHGALTVRVPCADPIDSSLLDEETTAHHVARLAQRSIDLRPFDKS